MIIIIIIIYILYFVFYLYFILFIKCERGRLGVHFAFDGVRSPPVLHPLDWVAVVVVGVSGGPEEEVLLLLLLPRVVLARHLLFYKCVELGAAFAFSLSHFQQFILVFLSCILRGVGCLAIRYKLSWCQPLGCCRHMMSCYAGTRSGHRTPGRALLGCPRAIFFILAQRE